MPQGPWYYRSANHEPTSRQLEIMVLVAEGKLNKEIAKALGIKEQVVRNQLVDICRRIGVRNRVGVAMYIANKRTT